MEVAMIMTITLGFIMLLAFGFMFWCLRQISRSLKDIRNSLDHLTVGVALLCDQLTVLLYFELKSRPDLLEKSPELEKMALEAAERLGQRKLLALGENKKVS